MLGFGYLIMAGLVLLGLSALSDGQWGRGVRGAVRAASGQDAGGVRDRLSAAGSGWLSGRSDRSPSTRRTVGRTPPADTLLSGVLGKLSGLSGRAVRAVRDKVSGQRQDSRTQMLLVDPDGQARYVDVGMGEPYPVLQPGQRLHHLGLHGALTEPWTYDDQQAEQAREAATFAPSRFEPTHACGYCKDTKHWPGENDTCPWCTGALSLVYSERHPNGEVYGHQIGWTPGDRIPDSINGFRVMDPKSGDSTSSVTADELRSMSEQATQPIPAANAAGTPEGESNVSEEQHRMNVEMANNALRQMVAKDAVRAFENLPSYERFLTDTRDKVLGDMEDAKSGVQRHVQLSTSVGDGMSRLAALRVDVATIAEGGRVAEHAAVVRDRSTALAAALADLDSTVQAALAGLKRQQPAQELANSSVLAERPAYDGA